jgi:hypothetical protein
MGILAVSCGLLLAADAAPPKRIVTPEGWIEVEQGSADEGGGTFSVLPALPAAGTTAQASVAPPPVERPSLPPAVREPCARLLARVLGRIAWLHDLVPTDDPISPAVRATLYPAGSAFANPNEPPIELSWDSELRDRFEAYNRCLLHARR